MLYLENLRKKKNTVPYTVSDCGQTPLYAGMHISGVSFNLKDNKTVRKKGIFSLHDETYISCGS